MRNQALLARLSGTALALALVVAATPGEGAPPVVTDLGTLDGGAFSLANGLNAQGQIAGSSDSSAGFRAVFSDGAPLVDLGTLGGTSSFGNAINAAGQVAGVSRNAQRRNRAFRWDAVGGMQDLGVLPGGTSSTAHGINGAGYVVGESNTLVSPFVFHGFFWTPATGMVDLGALWADGSSVAFGVNDSDQVTGEADLDTGVRRAFVWTSTGGFVDLGTLPGGTFTRGRAINNQGQVVGWGDVAGGVQRGFLWDPVAGFTIMPPLPGGGDTFAAGLNDLGQVVGQAIASTGEARAVVWDPATGLLDLPTLAGGSFAAAYAINNDGQVVGESETGTGESHAVRWQLNRPPTAQGGAASTIQDTPVALTLGGGDPDGDALGFAIATGPGNGTLSGIAPNLVYTPAPGWSGSDSFTFTVTDGTATSAPATVQVTVVPAPPQDDVAGRMKGRGHLDGHRHFVFGVGKLAGGDPVGHLHYWQPAPAPARVQGHEHWRFDHFVATAVTAAAFSDDPAVTPGKKPNPAVDTVVFSGTGRWNGVDGHTFEVRAVDAGEPGKGRDTVAIVIKAPDGAEVASASGLLAGGNVQSKKVTVVPPAVVAAKKK